MIWQFESLRQVRVPAPYLLQQLLNLLPVVQLTIVNKMVPPPTLSNYLS